MLLREPFVRMLHGCKKLRHAALSSKAWEPERGSRKQRLWVKVGSFCQIWQLNIDFWKFVLQGNFGSAVSELWAITKMAFSTSQRVTAESFWPQRGAHIISKGERAIQGFSWLPAARHYGKQTWRLNETGRGEGHFFSSHYKSHTATLASWHNTQIQCGIS